MDVDDALYRLHSQEIRRGSVVTAVLSLLEEPQYGYALIELLNTSGIETDANTLYPLLRRMEKQGLLESIWNTEESRPRKYYQVTADGKLLRDLLLKEWNSITTALNKLSGETP